MRAFRGQMGLPGMYYPPYSSSSGLPNPLVAVAGGGIGTWQTMVANYRSTVGATPNTITYFQNLGDSIPTAYINQIDAANLYQIMTIQPTTGTWQLAGGIRTTGGTVDNPMVNGTSYLGIVLGAAASNLNGVTQPSGTYISGLPSIVSTTTSVANGAASGTHVTTTAFTATGSVTSVLPYDFAGLAAGNYDATIQAYATAFAGKKAAIRWAHEMNGTWYAWSVNTTGSIACSTYIGVWQHCRTAWQAKETALGVGHVPWIWCVNISGNSSGTIGNSGTTASTHPIYPPATLGAAGANSTCYYPGDTYVDYIALDGYTSTASTTFSNLFSDDVQWIHADVSTKPIIITETGIDAGVGAAARATWIAAIPTFLSTFTYVVGSSYFNENVSAGNYLLTSATEYMAMLAAVKAYT